MDKTSASKDAFSQKQSGVVNSTVAAKKESKEENELMELIYMGKVYDSVDNKDVQCYRQILVRRKRCLQVMFTNGLMYMTYDVPGSFAQKPFIISDIMLNANGDKLIVFYSIIGKDT